MELPDSTQPDIRQRLPNLVDNALAHRTRSLAFPPEIESLFESDTGAERRTYLFRSGLVAILTYNMFFLWDRFVVPDIIETMFFLRLAVATPIAVGTILLIRYSASAHWRELTCAFATIVVYASLLAPLVASRHPNAVFCHPTVVVGSVFSNVLLRPRFPYAAATSAALLVGYAIVLSLCRLDIGVSTFLFSTLSSATFFTLLAVHSIEKEQRRVYLFSLRDRLKQASLEEANEELSSLARLDPLTGLANRRAFDSRMEDVARQPATASLIMIDVDHFKAFNDLHGHQAGDECLRSISRVLQELIREKDDLAARYGGEEFAVILAHSSLAEAAQVAERLRAAILALGIAHGGSETEARVSVSLGAAEAGGSPGNLVARADAALYRAKSEGRNRVCTHGIDKGD